MRNKENVTGSRTDTASLSHLFYFELSGFDQRIS